LAEAVRRQKHGRQHGQSPKPGLRRSHVVTTFVELRYSETACLMPAASASPLALFPAVVAFFSIGQSEF
jgi:hypothetical protein